MNFILCSVITVTVFSTIGHGHLPEESMNASQLIINQGYPVERHSIETDDGYILGCQRIPNGRHGSSPTVSKHPILVMHGLGACSTCWLTNLWNESLAYILADAGYDVWLGNVRGTIYSQKHKTLTTKDPKFWDFSWEDMADHDLPAMVNYISQITGEKSISYVGHSQGTLMAFASFSTNSDIASKIKHFFALAPVTTVTYITSPIRDLAPFTAEIYDLALLYGADEKGTLDWILNYIKPECDNPTIDKDVCENILFWLLGAEDVKLLNQTRIPVYIAHNPAGTSMKNIAHYGQMINSGKMQRFDYGWIRNLFKYHSLKPPEYDMTAIENDVTLFWSKKDALADPQDVAGLLPLLEHHTAYQVLDYSHIDFLWAMNTPQSIYNRLVKILRGNK